MEIIFNVALALLKVTVLVSSFVLLVDFPSCCTMLCISAALDTARN